MGFFSRYFEGYSEDRRPGDDGRLHTVRVYRGFWYVPGLSKLQRALRCLGYLALYAAGAALFLTGAARREIANSTPYVGLATGVSLFALLIEAIPLAGCAFGSRRQTSYQYRSGSKTCILWARITAGAMALTAALALLAGVLEKEVGLAPLLFALGSACEAGIGLVESSIEYHTEYNENA